MGCIISFKAAAEALRRKEEPPSLCNFSPEQLEALEGLFAFARAKGMAATRETVPGAEGARFSLRRAGPGGDPIYHFFMKKGAGGFPHYESTVNYAYRIEPVAEGINFSGVLSQLRGRIEKDWPAFDRQPR